MGFTLNKKALSSTQFAQPNGIYRFSGMFSALNPAQQTTAANAVADILLGYPSSYSLQSQPYLQGFHYTHFGAYFQDDWKVTRNLTLNLGLRWEYFGKPTDRRDAIGSFDERTGQQLLPGQNGLPRSLVFPAYRDFGSLVSLGEYSTVGSPSGLSAAHVESCIPPR
jgi:outer membrane receptor protein involved in Fe transport